MAGVFKVLTSQIRGGIILNMPRVRGETFLFDPQRLLTGDQLQDEYLEDFGGGGVYVHDTVVHQENFVHPADGDVHTQSVESLWNRAKSKLRKGNGTSQALLESYVKEAMWRESYAKDQQKEVFGSVLRLIAEYYVV